MEKEVNIKIDLPKYTKKKMSKADVVYDFLLDGIIKGVWLSGDRVNDKEIAEHLGVNRLAVREALSRLAQNDIIEQVQWKGYYIRNITEEDVQSLVQVRIALENLAMYLFLTKDDDVQQKYLKLIQKTIDDSIQFLKEGNHAKYMEIDFRFHELIYEASGNNMIAKVIGNTRLITSIMRNLSMGKEFEQAAMTSIQEHQNVFDALKAKDLEGAKKALYHHLANTFVTNIFKNIPHIY